MIVTWFKNLFNLIFGDFDKEELKKFLLLGLIFGLIIGIYWTLRPMKDAIIPRHRRCNMAASRQMAFSCGRVSRSLLFIVSSLKSFLGTCCSMC